MKIALFGLKTSELINFRGWLIDDLIAAGHEVVACAPDPDPASIADLRRRGAGYRAVSFDRTALDPLSDLRLIGHLRLLLAEIAPDALLVAGAKPVVYGTIAAKLQGVPRIFSIIEGMGYAFGTGREVRRRLARLALSGLYRATLRHSSIVFVMNEGDRDFLNRSGLFQDRDRTVLVNGTGIDLEQFPCAVPPSPSTPSRDGDGAPVRFLMIARLLKDKGVVEYVRAARRLRRTHPNCEFHLLGRVDRNPASVRPADVARWQEEGIIRYGGEVGDVRPHLRGCDVFVLPSYYREGVPRTILEAMATGRPVIATDEPGCRQAVVDGETGLLVPSRDVGALAAAMDTLRADSSLRRLLGLGGRRRVEREFEAKAVNAVMIRAMGLGARTAPRVPRVSLEVEPADAGASP